MNETRSQLAVEYFVKALTTGERLAAQRLAPLLAEEVVFETNSQPGVPPVGRDRFTGRASVLERLSGDWPATPAYRHLGWSEPIAADGWLHVTSSENVELFFGFNDAEELSEVHLDGGWVRGFERPRETGGPVSEIPLWAKGLINGALLNQTPIVVTHVDPEGVPHTTWRGSVCVIGPHQLGLWVRNANGGFAAALSANPHLTFAYSDFRSWHFINISGLGHTEGDAGVRRLIYERSPEREQLHDIDRQGVAVVVEVTSLLAFSGGIAQTLERAERRVKHDRTDPTLLTLTRGHHVSYSRPRSVEPS